MDKISRHDLATSCKCITDGFFWVLADQEERPQEKLDSLLFFGEHGQIQPKPNISTDLWRSTKMGLESILGRKRHGSSLFQLVHELEALLFEDLSKSVGAADWIRCGP
jgi:hypothetical protein